MYGSLSRSLLLLYGFRGSAHSSRSQYQPDVGFELPGRGEQLKKISNRI